MDIIADYIVSSVYLKPFAERRKLGSEAIAANADDIENFIQHIKSKYTNAEQYLLLAGVSYETIKKIKESFINK